MLMVLLKKQKASGLIPFLPNNSSNNLVGAWSM
jgi:hypothetical protein